MRATKPILAGAVTLALLAGSAANVVAQESPGFGVSVTQECEDIYATPVICAWTASNPGLTGTLSHEWVGDIYSVSDASVGWAPATLTGPEGGPEGGNWTGHLYAVWTDPARFFVFLSGDGAYDGWQYVASTIDSALTPGDSEWVGAMYEGEPPPFGPLETPAE